MLNFESLKALLNFTEISFIFLSLILFLFCCILTYASRYLKFDRLKRAFFLKAGLLAVCLSVLACADHIVLFALCFASSYSLLLSLMIHKKSWRQANASGLLALKYLGSAMVCMALALSLFYLGTGDTSLKQMLQASMPSPYLQIGLGLLVLCALIQSALWPFQGWLLSSLNSPTPVSALMHAGLINGGGYLLIMVAPLLVQAPILLNLVFVFGVFTALLGTFWKLMQHDVKRLLACSTMGQMGFMFVQCGLGLFPAALAHLCLHGLFKAFLFLSHNELAFYVKTATPKKRQATILIYAILCGLLGGFVFAFIHQLQLDAQIVLLVIAILFLTQLSLTCLEFQQTKIKYLLTPILSGFIGLVYAGTIQVFEASLSALSLMHPQPLNFLHVAAMVLMVASWILSEFWLKEQPGSVIWQKLYVAMLNAAQPHAKTITAIRQHYDYR